MPATRTPPQDLPLWARRILVVFVGPVAIIVAVVDRVWREIRSIPFLISCDVREEIAVMRAWWRRDV